MGMLSDGGGEESQLQEGRKGVYSYWEMFSFL